MKRASDEFSEKQREEIEQAVVAAEAKTSCEIVPVVATSSGRYDRPEDIVGLWMATVAAVAIWMFYPRSANDVGTWGGLPDSLGILVLIVGIEAAFIAGALIASRIDWLRRLFTPKQQMEDEVARQARQLFFDNRVHHTEGSTGLLICISMFEHIAVVLGDRSVMEKLGQSFLDELTQQLTTDLRTGDKSLALKSAIAAAGEKLSSVFPRADDDINELHDTLVLID